MALKIVWTKRAQNGFDGIVEYLEENWTEREVRNFIRQSMDFFELLSQFPELLKTTAMLKNVHRGPMNKFTILTYRINRKKNRIELLNIRSAYRKPLKG